MDAKRGWIREWRARYGLTTQDMARCMTDVFGKHVSEVLIRCVEVGDPIHPGIAARIALLTGGTAAQFDAITYETRRGTWRPDAAERRNVRARFDRWMQRYTRQDAQQAARKKSKRRRVVMIGADGEVIREYASACAAADECGVKLEIMLDRCRGIDRDDFRKHGAVWRYAESFTAEERDRIIRMAQKQLKPIEDIRHVSMYDRIELDGEIHTLAEWAERLNATVGVIRGRIQRRWSKRDALTIPVQQQGGWKYEGNRGSFERGE